MRRRCLLCAVFACALFVAPASASQLIDRNPTGLTLQLNAKGEALLTYHSHGRLKHVLAWGALNAVSPSTHARQVEFQLDYTGGYGKYFKQNAEAQSLAAKFRRGGAAATEVAQLRALHQSADRYWQTGFHGGCGRYTGPTLVFATITCTAPDGSYWAVQEWQRELPDYGVPTSPAQSVLELRLSHWTGALCPHPRPEPGPSVTASTRMSAVIPPVAEAAIG